MAGFSDFGLGMQGVNAARGDEQALELGKQRIQTGKMGLDEASRVEAAKASERSAVSGSTGGMDETYERVGRARRASGDLSGLEANTASQYANTKAAQLRLAEHAQTGGDPVQAEKELRAAGFGQQLKPGTLQWGKDPQTGDHLIMYEDSNGQRQARNATEIIRANSEQKVHTVPAGGSAIVTQRGASPRIMTAPNKDKFELKDGILFNESTGKYEQVNTTGRWTLGKITHGNQEVPVAIDGSTGAVNLLGPGGVRTGLDAHVSQPSTPGGQIIVTMPGGATSVFTPGTEGAPGKTNLFSANTPPTPATPPRLTPVVADTPPVEGAQKAPDGKWYVRSGNGYAEVIVSGGPPAAGAAPKPAAAAAPKPQPAPAPAATPVKADEDRIPEVTPESAPGLSPAARHQSRVSAARGEQDKARELAPKKRAVETFRSIAASPRMTAEDAPLIKEAIDTGLLTPAEKSKAERMLAKLQPQTAGHANGGKVARYGL